MKIKFSNFLKLYESPDFVSLNLLQDANINTSDILKWIDEDAISFGYYDNDYYDHIFVSDWGETHEEALEYIEEYDRDRSDMKYPGRLWIDSKVISFWEYPDNYDELRKILDDLEKEIFKKLKYKIIFDDEWWIEVIFNGDEQVINKYKFWGDSELYGDERYIDESKLIKIKDYKGSGKRSEEELKMNHIKVGSGGKVNGFGSDYHNEDKPIPKGMSQAEYNDKKSKYKFTESFDLFLESADTIYTNDIYVNITTGIPFVWNEKINDIIVGKYGTIHSSNNITYTHWIGYENDGFNYHGRLWLDEKIMSFWNYPDSKMFKIMIYKLEEKLNIKIWGNDWKVEVLKSDNEIYNGYNPNEIDGDHRSNYDLEIIPIEDYIGSKDVPKELLNIHLLNASDKAKALKDIGYKPKILNLPDGMSQDEYRNKKTKYKFTESFNSFITEESVAQFTYNDKLNQKFWENDLFDERIREKLITIANEFYNDFGYDAPIEDILLTGSLANFNYNEFSDVDVHVAIDFSKINKDVNLVKKAVDGYRFMWNLRHNIRIKGHDVELYIQDINEPHTASGLYSLMNAEWITKPQHNQPTIEKELVDFKFLTYKSGIEKLIEISQREMTPEVAIKNHLFASEYKNKIMKGRKYGLENGGEFSVENLVFKKLRNSGDFKKLIDVIGVFYDKIYSQVQ